MIVASLTGPLQTFEAEVDSTRRRAAGLELDSSQSRRLPWVRIHEYIFALVPMVALLTVDQL